MLKLSYACNALLIFLVIMKAGWIYGIICAGLLALSTVFHGIHLEDEYVNKLLKQSHLPPLRE